MVDSAGSLGDVVDECAAGPAEFVVEGDAGGQAAEAGQDAFAQAGEGAGAVAFEGEQVFAGPEDALDALADRGQMRTLAGLVFAARADDRGAEGQGVGLELPAGVALIADDGDRAGVAGSGDQLQRDVAFAVFGAGDLQRSWGCRRGRTGRAA